MVFLRGGYFLLTLVGLTGLLTVRFLDPFLSFLSLLPTLLRVPLGLVVLGPTACLPVLPRFLSWLGLSSSLVSPLALALRFLDLLRVPLLPISLSLNYT